MAAKDIVVPLDGSVFAERALPVARGIARRVGARVVLMTTDWGDDTAPRDSRAYLERLAARNAEIPTDVMLVDVHPAAAAIASAAATVPDSIVCMASHGRGALRWAMLGSVAQDVVRHSAQPIILVGRHCMNRELPEMEHMLVCVGGGNVAEPIVPVAATWAKALGLDARVAYVSHPLDVEGGAQASAVLDAIVDELATRGVSAAPVLLRGSFVAGAIVDYARSLPVSMIALNTHARAGVRRLALGSVAMATVGLAECPLLLAPFPHDGRGS